MTLEIKRQPLALPQKRISASSRWISYLSLFSAFAVVGVLFNNGIIGQIVVVIIGFLAVLVGIKGEESFKLAIAAFVILMICTALRIDMLAQHFSIYAFLFLCIGLVSALKDQLYSPSDVLIKSSVIQSYSRKSGPIQSGKQALSRRRVRSY